MSNRDRYKKPETKKVNQSWIGTGAYVFIALVLGLFLAGVVFPAQSRWLYGLLFFLLSLILIAAGAIVFWLTWIKPRGPDLIIEGYRKRKASWGRFSWLWFLPDSFYPTYLRLIAIPSILLGLFVLVMVVDYFILGHEKLVISIPLP